VSTCDELAGWPAPKESDAVVWHDPNDYSYALRFNYQGRQWRAFGPNTHGPTNMHAYLMESLRVQR